MIAIRKALCILMMVVMISGCTKRICTQDVTVYNEDKVTTRVVKVERACPDDNGFHWYYVPLLIVAAPVIILFMATDRPSSSPHYQAGGSALKDYTLPQNQPLPQPTYQQQQINMGNGGGQYGNYPKY